MAPKNQSINASSSGYVNDDEQAEIEQTEVEQETTGQTVAELEEAHMIETYVSEHLLNEMLMAEDALGSIAAWSDDNLATILKMLEEKESQMKTLKTLLNKETTKRKKEVEKAENEAIKAREKAEEEAIIKASREAKITVRVLLPNGASIYITISKNKTLGALRRRAIAKCQKLGMFKKLKKLSDVAMVFPNTGVNLLSRDRPYLYNTQSLLDNPTLAIMMTSDFTEGMNIEVPPDSEVHENMEEQAVENDDDDTDEEEEEVVDE
eukprot:Skav225243  [mRNA]  locus=scaffold3165:7926:8720:- [translate_table: standard]